MNRTSFLLRFQEDVRPAASSSEAENAAAGRPTQTNQNNEGIDWGNFRLGGNYTALPTSASGGETEI